MNEHLYCEECGQKFADEATMAAHVYRLYDEPIGNAPMPAPLVHAHTGTSVLTRRPKRPTPQWLQEFIGKMIPGHTPETAWLFTDLGPGHDWVLLNPTTGQVW